MGSEQPHVKQQREKLSPSESETDVNNDWSKTVDAVLTGKDEKFNYPHWLQALPEDEQNKLTNFFLRSAFMYCELRENVKADMKTRFGISGYKVEELYSVFLDGKEAKQEKLSVMKNDPAHSLGLAGEKATTKFTAPHEKKAWNNARRLDFSF